MYGEVGWVSDIAEASSSCTPAVYCHLHQHIGEGGGDRGCGTGDDVRPGGVMLWWEGRGGMREESRGK